MSYDAHAGRWILIHAYVELDLTRVLLRDVTDEVEDWQAVTDGKALNGADIVTGPVYTKKRKGTRDSAASPLRT